MALEYLPIMAQSSAPKPPRVLVSPSNPSWCAVKKPVNQSRVALLTSAALRLNRQEPFAPGEDLTYRLIPSDSQAKRDCDRSPFAHWSGATPESRNRFSHGCLGKSRCKANLGKLVSHSRFVYGRCPAPSRGRKRTRPGDCSGAEASRR